MEKPSCRFEALDLNTIIIYWLDKPFQFEIEGCIEDDIDEWLSFTWEDKGRRVLYDVHIFRENLWKAVDVLVYPTKVDDTGNISTDASTWKKLEYYE